MHPKNHHLRWQMAAKRQKVKRQPLPAQEAASLYLPLSTHVLTWGERITFNLYIKVLDKGTGGIVELKYQPLAEVGEVLPPEWCQTLSNARIDRLYFHRRDVDTVIAYLNNHLLLKGDEPENTQEKSHLLREHLNLSLINSFDSPHLGRNLKLMKDTLQHLLPLLLPEQTPWKLLSELLYRDYTIYQHSVNVGTLAMAMGVFLRKSQRDCVVLGMAGLFHDLGLTRLDKELVNKRETLTREEWELLKTHPSLGYQLLKGNPEMPLAALRLVLEHHEAADGSGYPQGLPLHRQHPLTRILFLAEAYDGLTTHRPYRQAYTPFAALKILQGKTGKAGPACDSQTLKDFIRFLAFS